MVLHRGRPQPSSVSLFLVPGLPRGPPSWPTATMPVQHEKLAGAAQPAVAHWAPPMQSSIGGGVRGSATEHWQPSQLESNAAQEDEKQQPRSQTAPSWPTVTIQRGPLSRTRATACSSIDACRRHSATVGLSLVLGPPRNSGPPPYSTGLSTVPRLLLAGPPSSLTAIQCGPTTTTAFTNYTSPRDSQHNSSSYPFCKH